MDAPGAVAVSADGVCALREAPITADDDAATHPGCPAGAGADTIELAADSTYTLAAAPAACTADGPHGLPSVTTAITLNGHGATIERRVGDAIPPFRCCQACRQLPRGVPRPCHSVSPVRKGGNPGWAAQVAVHGWSLYTKHVRPCNGCTTRPGRSRLPAGASQAARATPRHH